MPDACARFEQCNAFLLPGWPLREACISHMTSSRPVNIATVPRSLRLLGWPRCLDISVNAASDSAIAG